MFFYKEITDKKKLEAIKRMEIMRLKPYIIRNFKNKDKIFVFEKGYTRKLFDSEKVFINKFENANDAIVYAIVHMVDPFGYDVFRFFYVVNNESEWEQECSMLETNFSWVYQWSAKDGACKVLAGFDKSDGLIYVSRFGMYTKLN